MLTSIVQKSALSLAVNMVLAGFLAVTIPEWVLGFGGAFFWGALGGITRALFEGKKGKMQLEAMMASGWPFVIIGGLSATAFAAAHFPFLDDYVKDLPQNSVEFLVGNFCVTAYTAIDSVLGIRFFGKGKESET